LPDELRRYPAIGHENGYREIRRTFKAQMARQVSINRTDLFFGSRTRCSLSGERLGRRGELVSVPAAG
jgi:hypothetical protein